MGLFKKTAKTVGYVAKAPTKFMYPDAVKNNNERLFNYKGYIKTVYCPNCGEAYLHPFDYSNVPEECLDTIDSFQLADPYKHAYWTCGSCYYVIEVPLNNRAPKNTIEDVKQVIREIDFEEGSPLDEMPDIERTALVTRHMNTCYIFFFSFIGVSLLALFLLLSGSIISGIIAIFFAATFVMYSLNWSYRAWQVHTGNVFSDTPKQQFTEWLTNNNPLKYP